MVDSENLGAIDGEWAAHKVKINDQVDVIYSKGTYNWGIRIFINGNMIGNVLRSHRFDNLSVCTRTNAIRRTIRNYNKEHGLVTHGKETESLADKILIIGSELIDQLFRDAYVETTRLVECGEC